MPVIRSCWRIHISIWETLVSSHDLVSMLIRIIVSMRFHHLISEIRLSRTSDLVLLVVTNRSMRYARLESWFIPHVDINYCARENFTGRLNISPCFLLSYMFKLDDVMPMIWSCWWIQISVWGHNLVVVFAWYKHISVWGHKLVYES
jgi:hypothetical protein